LHRHTREAEAFYLLDGRISYRAGEEDFELYDGCFMYLPQGVPTPSGSAGRSRLGSSP
jgi:mannose-6-phosphate isomerase-like protein (cupin superfamily)